MQKSLKALKQQSIISSDEIQSLRHNLLMTHPNLTEAQHIRIFKNYFHAKLDDALALFDRPLQRAIKHQILQRTHYNQNFTVNAFDIVEIYSQIEPVDPAYLKQLTSWVNQYELHPLSEEHLLWLTKAMGNGRSLGPFFIQNFRFKLELGMALSALCGSLLFSINYRQNLELTSFFNLGSIETSVPQFEVTNTPLYSDLKKDAEEVKDNSPIILADEEAAFVILSPEEIEDLQEIPMPVLDLPDNDLHAQLKYKIINQDALKEWLVERNSLLASEPYFSTIMETAQHFNVNPLLLFAITGQEQNFVPKSQESASKIANNPFNLYGSWKEYNTSIEDSARIAARTIVNLGKGCPKNEDQIAWINQQYAADPNWHIGVSYFLNELETVTVI